MTPEELKQKHEAMTKDQRSLLLFLESAAVERGGTFSAMQVNSDDGTLLAEWKITGFIKCGRIASHDIDGRQHQPKTHWVILSDDAWAIAGMERRARCCRLMEKLTVQRNGLD